MFPGVYDYIKQEYGNVTWSRMMYANSGGTTKAVADHSKETPTGILLHSLQWDNGANVAITFTDQSGKILLVQSSFNAGNYPAYLGYVMETKKMTINASVAPTMFVIGYQYFIKEKV
jgi:hypothetical protein